MPEDYISQFHVWATGNTLTAPRLNGNESNVTDGLSGGVKAVNIGKILIGGTTVLDSSRVLQNITDLTVDNLNINGNAISSTSGAINLTPVSGSAVVLDSHFSFDGTVLTALINSNTTITAYAGRNITIEGMTIDGGVVAGISDLTATAITGTLQTAAQANITSLGTLTSLKVSGNLGAGTTSPNAQLEVFAGNGDGVASPETKTIAIFTHNSAGVSAAYDRIGQILLAGTSSTSVAAIGWEHNRNYDSQGKLSLYTKNSSGVLTKGFTIDSSQNITLGVWTATTIGVAYGGTGQTSYTNGQLLIGNTTGNTLTKATLTGTANQVVVTNGTGTITLSLPQSIATSSSPTFVAISLTDTLTVTKSGGAIIKLDDTSSNYWKITSADTLAFDRGGTVLTTIGNFGQMGIGGASFASLRPCIFLATSSSAISGTPSGGGVIYVETVTGKLRYKGPGGTDTILALS